MSTGAAAGSRFGDVRGVAMYVDYHVAGGVAYLAFECVTAYLSIQRVSAYVLLVPFDC